MRRSTHYVRYVAAAALLLTLAACGSDDEPAAQPTPTPTSTPSATGTATPTASDSPSPSESAASGGTADAPEALTASTDPLDWQPVDGSVDEAVTRNDDWTLTVTGNSDRWELTGPGSDAGASTAGWRVSDALLDDDWAVVVLQDKQERRPSKATVTNLKNGKAFEVDGSSDVPTTTGGAWALGDGRLLHATYDGSAYCLAEVDLTTHRSTVTWCAPKRQGFNAAHITEAGASVLSFDDSQPSCRTVVSIDAGDAVPFTGPPDCQAWEGLLTDDGAVWSTIPRPQRIEEAHYFARVGEGYYDLGPGVAGTLTECDDAAYFVRDPQEQGGPATLMRWTSDSGLSVAYESPKGQAFLEEPRCGGDTMTVTARTSSGDEQVSADL